MTYKILYKIKLSNDSKIVKTKINENSKSILNKIFPSKNITYKEVEDFDTNSIIKGLNLVFKKSDITNLVRISHDKDNFYLDYDDKKNDLDSVLENYQQKYFSAYERYYNKLVIIAEHEERGIHFIISVNIFRKHKKGNFPIKIEITASKINNTKKDLSSDFKFITTRFYKNVQKYLNVKEIKTFIPGKTSSSKKKSISSIDYSLFPLYKVDLGITSEKQLSKLGIIASDTNSEGDLYKYYSVEGTKFWFSNGVASHIHLTRSNLLPEKWENIGFKWELSYKSWISLLKKQEYLVSVIVHPQVLNYKGSKSFNAKLLATKKLYDKRRLNLKLTFAYSQGTKTNTKNTIYSMSVYID